MKQSETIRSSLTKVMEIIVPRHSYYVSVEQLGNTFANFELNIENLEARVQSLEAEIQVLIAEQ